MSQTNLDSFMLDDELVAEYLMQHPDFFNRFPQLPCQLKISHAQRGSVSLVELSQQRLREKVAELESEITDLMSVARRNEQIYRVYVGMLPQLLRCYTFAELQLCLYRALVEQLGLSGISIRLNRAHVDVAKELQDYSLSGEQVENLRVTRLSHAEHYFGRLTHGEKELLFDEPEQAASVALVPLGEQARIGLFAASSRDSDHYVAGMDSLLLGKVCEVIATLLPKLVRSHAV